VLIKGPGPDYLHVETSYREMETGKPGGQRFYPDGLAAVNLKPGATPKEIAVALRRGVTVKGRVLQPDDQPLQSNTSLLACRSFLFSGFTLGHSYRVIAGDGTFDLPGCDLEKAIPMFFLDAQSQLGARVEVSGKQGREEPMTVRLAPCGSARVRFVDQKG